MADGKERKVVFDLIRILCSFLVVHLHVVSFIVGKPYGWDYYLGWYAVPFFVAITFFLNAQSLTSDTSFRVVVRKVLRFLIPFAFWSAVGFLLHPDMWQAKYVARQILTGTAVNPPLYYLLSISIVTVFIGVVYKIFKNWWKVVLGAALLLLLGGEILGITENLMSHIPVQIEFVMSRTLEIAKYATAITVLLSIPLTLALSRIVIAICVVSLIAVPISLSSKVMSQASGGYTGLIQWLAVVSSSYYLGLRKILVSERMTKYIQAVGKYALGVYCIHFLIVERLVEIRIPSPMMSVGIYCLSWAIAWTIDKISAGKLARVVT